MYDCGPQYQHDPLQWLHHSPRHRPRDLTLLIAAIVHCKSATSGTMESTMLVSPDDRTEVEVVGNERPSSVVMMAAAASWLLVLLVLLGFRSMTSAKDKIRLQT